MIPRYQTVLFVILLAASVVMSAVLWQLRNRAHQRLLSGRDSAPTQAPQVALAEQATLEVASDQENGLMAQALTLPLPQSPNARAQAILGKLLDLYAAPNSPHPVPGGAAGVAQVFLLPAARWADPSSNSGLAGSNSAAKSPRSEDQLAVVNLTGAFVGSHPSGIETETLTVLSICATLHANLPEVMQVRFLVDGQLRPNLAGHADLTRTYLTADAVPTEGSH